MEMVALVVVGILAMAVIEHQKRSMERLARIRANRPEKDARRRG